MQFWRTRSTSYKLLVLQNGVEKPSSKSIQMYVGLMDLGLSEEKKKENSSIFQLVNCALRTIRFDAK